MSNTKIVVFQMKELVYTALFVILGILLVVVLVIMFRSGHDKDSTEQASLYQPGVYSSELNIGDQTLNVCVCVDSDHVNSVEIENLSESITTMYPLVESSLEDIETNLTQGVALNDIPLSDENRYTKILILEAVDEALAKAKNPAASKDES